VGSRSQGHATFNLLHSRLICGGTVHAKQEVILILDQKDQHVLAQLVFVRRHIMLGMGEQSGLEDGGQIARIHPILVGFGSEDRQEVENIQEQLLVQRGELSNELLVR
jgi:hypothetical protein